MRTFAVPQTRSRLKFEERCDRVWRYMTNPLNSTEEIEFPPFPNEGASTVDS